MREVFGDKDPVYEEMHRLTYTQAVISETLRLHPSVPVDAKVRKRDVVLQNCLFNIFHSLLFSPDSSPPLRWL
jgi:cytochrome P450